MTALDITLKDYAEDDKIPPIKVWNAAISEAIRLIKKEIEVLRRHDLQIHATGKEICEMILRKVNQALNQWVR